MKGAIQSNHIPKNNYKLLVLGMPELTVISHTSIEEELDTTELPDRTVASGGETKPTEFDIMIPAHHKVEQAAMELWFVESQEPVSPTYKKVATLVKNAIDGTVGSTNQLVGVFPKKRVIDEGEMANEGEMSNVTWTLSIDKVLPI
jgi:hypothetical protein